MTWFNNSILVLIRGLPGSGKSSLADLMCKGLKENQGDRAISEIECARHETDKYFYNKDESGTYLFQPELIGDAHKWNQAQVERSMSRDIPLVIVSNTFSQQWELDPYLKLADKYSHYLVSIIECQNKFENIHEVPEEAIQAMRDRWEEVKHEGISM